MGLFDSQGWTDALDFGEDVKKKVEAGALARLMKSLYGGAEVATQVASGLAAMPLAGGYGIYKGLTSPAKLGTPESNQISQDAARQAMEQLSWQPRTEVGQEYSGLLQEAFDKSKLPPLPITAGAITRYPMAAQRTAQLYGENLAAPRSMNSQLGAIGWHGTGHKFPPTEGNPLGEFDPKKVGTGEGAQVYGVGAAYIGGARKTAENYADNLAVTTPAHATFDGNRLTPSLVESMVNHPDPDVAKFFTHIKNGSRSYSSSARMHDLPDDVAEMARGYKVDAAHYADRVAEWDKNPPIGATITRDELLRRSEHYETKANLFDRMQARLGTVAKKEEKHLYKVDVADEAIPKMLDWDKPIDKQAELLGLPPLEKLETMHRSLTDRLVVLEKAGQHQTPEASSIRSQMNGISASINRYYVNNRTGGDYYQKLALELGSKEKASKALAETGVTGIKYLDGFSRNKGEGTHNYVPFDPAHAKIISRESPDGLYTQNPEQQFPPLLHSDVAGKTFGEEKTVYVNQGLYHAIGEGKKLPMPVDQMKWESRPSGLLAPRKVVSPEDVQGSMLIPAYGDRSDGGRSLLSVGGRELAEPVDLHGGAKFMQSRSDSGTVWANALSPASGIAKQVRKASDEGHQVVMPFVAMGHGSLDSSATMIDTLLQQMRGTTISNTAKKQFNVDVRKIRKEWRGFDDPQSMEALRSNATLREAVTDVMSLDKYQDRGFPNLAETRAAIIDPNLRDAPTGSGGYNLSLLHPEGKLVKDSPLQHPSFPVQIGGKYLGGFDRQYPWEVMFLDWWKKRRAGNAPTSTDHRSFLMGQPKQLATQEWLDGMMKWREANP